MQRFSCECGNVLFFESSQCLKCGHDVGFDPESRSMIRLMPGRADRWCDNGVRYGVCHWLVPRDSAAKLCLSCALNRTIPDLTSERNRRLWGRMEAAKRRLLYTPDGNWDHPSGKEAECQIRTRVRHCQCRRQSHGHHGTFEWGHHRQSGGSR
ncbi:MAG: zinc-ribbon domain-containing protein [Verrucomicrobiales bacterium]